MTNLPPYEARYYSNTASAFLKELRPMALGVVDDPEQDPDHRLKAAAMLVVLDRLPLVTPTRASFELVWSTCSTKGTGSVGHIIASFDEDECTVTIESYSNTHSNGMFHRDNDMDGILLQEAPGTAEECRLRDVTYDHATLHQLRRWHYLRLENALASEGGPHFDVLIGTRADEWDPERARIL